MSHLLLGEAFFKLIHPDDRTRAKAASRQALKKGPATFEQRIIRSDNSIAYLKCTIKPWLDEEGNVAGIYGGSVDITDIKTAQEEITRSESLQKAIFNSSLDALFIADFEKYHCSANKSLRKTNPNHGAHRLCHAGSPGKNTTGGHV